MSLHELKKGTKIIHEFILYLMKHDVNTLNIDINRNENNLDIIIKTQKCSKKLIERITDRVGDVKELEYEEYGWELMGESDSSSELELVGMLLDSFEIDDSDPESTVFKLKRVDNY